MRRSGGEELTFILILGVIITVLGVVLLMANSDIGIVFVILGSMSASIAAARKLGRGIRG
ncbi:MAG: hypothetical protein NDF55_07885 [archaeon GB-1867-005]|nr:hypothetical protein [Candidatus Culexmicrobium cathedralense]